MYYLDPPGQIDTKNLCCFAHRPNDSNYIFFFDQEPVNRTRNRDLFAAVSNANAAYIPEISKAALVTSEYNSNTVADICQFFNWKPYNYFYNGWAALDWFRGYNRSWLVDPPDQREIKHTFIMPNRIVLGDRSWRLKLIYHLLKHRLDNNLISLPEHCPGTQQSVMHSLDTLESSCPGITNQFLRLELPLTLADMSIVTSDASSKLDLIQPSMQCLVYLVTETVATDVRHHLTEKIFKPICMMMPFVLVSTAGSLAYLREFGFKTFGDFWDESYDTVLDDDVRLKIIGDLMADLDSMSRTQQQQLAKDMMPIVLHNFEHFYNGGFESMLWQELQTMLYTIQQDFAK
jgi:hypothetical protein